MTKRKDRSVTQKKNPSSPLLSKMLLLEHVAVVAASSSLASDITLCREGGQAAGEGAWHQPCPLGVPWVPAQGMTEEGDRAQSEEPKP